MSDPGIAREAEALIRSLTGVAHARIHSGPGGIDAVHVIATDDHAALHMAAHVRSALLAGLATPVVAARIHVRVAEPGAGADTAGTDPGPGPGGRIRLLHGPHDGSDFDHDDDDDTAPGAAGTGTGRPDGAPHDEAGADATARPRASQRPRLVAVDLERPGNGRVLCRVAIAYGAAVHRADAVAIDLPGAAAQAAAQAAVRALDRAGLDGLELDGLREVEIAGREYVLVALRRAANGFTRHRPGCAALFGSPERSAAEAAVRAAEDLT